MCITIYIRFELFNILEYMQQLFAIAYFKEFKVVVWK